MRKTKVVPVPSTDRDNRDAGKLFFITEMGAVQSEKWATRALLAAGFRSLMTMAFADAEPLLDEMMQCVSIIPDPKRKDVTRPLDDEDIDEVSTLLLLRSEIVELHTGFSIAAFLSNMGKAAQTTDNPTPDTLDTPTSPKPSEASSAPA